MTSKRIKLCFAIAVSAVAACCNAANGHVDRSSSARPTPGIRAGKVSAEARSGDRFHCNADPDCMTSCRFGAVSRVWYEKGMASRDCEDGCASKGLTARCQNRSYVTLSATGDPVAACTHLAVDSQ